LQETPDDIADIYAAARTKSPDVIKLTTLARTPEEAWPLVQILAKATVPTVVVGLGKPGVMLAVLGKKIGAPWTYAALERGMEAYPGQATVSALNEVYHYPSIARSTRLIGVTGFGEREYNTVSALNAALHHLELPARCLPVGVGSVRLFRKIMEAVKLAGVVVDAAHQETLLEIATEQHATAQTAHLADVLLHKDDTWSAYHTVSQAAARALTKLLQPRYGDEPLKERMMLVVGVNTLARAVATELQRRGASLILASRLRKAGLQTAQALGCRFVQFEALYTTLHDVLVVCDEEKEDAAGRSLGPGIHAGYLRPGMAVMDLTANFRKSDLLKEAQSRDALIVDPRDILLHQLELQARLLTGKPVPREVLAVAVPEVDDE
jgi:3-dehydroquinate dehydratase/shikimate dehydrogenase